MKKITQSIGILLGAPALLIVLVWGYGLYVWLGEWLKIEEASDVKIFAIFGVLLSLLSVLLVFGFWYDKLSQMSCDRCKKIINVEDNIKHIIQKNGNVCDLCEHCKGKVEIIG